MGCWFFADGGFDHERAGRLWLMGSDRRMTDLRGLPDIADEGQGGLLDVLVPQDFASRERFTLAQPSNRAAAKRTALIRARLNEVPRR